MGFLRLGLGVGLGVWIYLETGAISLIIFYALEYIGTEVDRKNLTVLVTAIQTGRKIKL